MASLRDLESHYAKLSLKLAEKTARIFKEDKKTEVFMLSSGESID